MDLTQSSGFKRRPAPSSPPGGVREAPRSPPPCSPSLSVSSPSSPSSSPMSTSSSLCVNASAYQNHVKGPSQGLEVPRVSSTSAPVAVQPDSPPPPSTSCSDALLQTLAPPTDGEMEERKTEMYDPFSPTEGAKEEEEGEKYDPFEPTGSPASDADNGNGGGEEEGVKEEQIDAERDEEEEEEEKDKEPPDSTDALTSPRLTSPLHLRRRVDRSTSKPGEQREGAESEHSEIEEGEIVGLADRDRSTKRAAEDVLPLNSPAVSFFGSKPERILRVLDGDGFVSVRTEGTWEAEPEEEPIVGVEDLRRKLVSRRKERYLSFPPTSPLSPHTPPPPTSAPSSPITPPTEQNAKTSKSSKSSKERDAQKGKDRKAGEKEERRKKRRKDKDGGRDRSKEKDERHKKDTKGRRSSRSSSRKRKKRRHGSRDNSSGRVGHGRRSEDRHRDRDRDRDRDRTRDRDRDRDRERERDRGRDRDREREREHSRRRDDRDRDDRDREDRDRDDRDRDDRDRDDRDRDDRDRDSSSRKKDRDHRRRRSSSRDRGRSKRSKRRSRDRDRDIDRERQRDRERRRDGRPVVPPSIQDLNGSDLFAIKRTITVTTTTTTTTVPGSPRLTPSSPCHPPQDTGKPHKRKKKRKWHSAGEVDDRGSGHSRSPSLSPPRYHSYESDHYSDKLEIDVLSLDGEALDSDYPSLEDTPPAVLPPEPPVPSPKTKQTPKSGRHQKKKSFKKTGLNDSASNRTKNKCLSSMMVTSGSTSSSGPAAKRARKVGKDKEREKGGRKELGRSGKSKKEGGASRKGKLQSKVSVLVRDGVSSTTGGAVGSGKLPMDLLGPGGGGSGSGSSVVGGSIAVVFCRDNESRSPFLKPCSEPLSLSGRGKELALGKRGSLAPPPPSSLTSPAGLKNKKTKPSSITSTSSSASSPSSSLATKRRRRLGKKTRDKGGAAGLTAGESSQLKASSEGWGGASLDGQSAVGDVNKSVSPHPGPAGPAACSSSSSSSSSSTSVLPPSSSPPHTPPPVMAALRDTRDSSPDSQTVDSSCKTPDPSFLAEDCPTQTSPALPASSPSSLSAPQGGGLGMGMPTPTKPPPPDDTPKSVSSPPCSSSLSLPLSSSDPSSSSVSSSSATKPPPPPPPPPAAPALPWSLQTGVDCTTGGVLALTALLFKMEEANMASRAKAQEFIQATSQILSQANQNQSQQHAPPSSASSASSQIPPPPSLPPPPGLSPAQFILHSSLPLVGCTKTPPSLLHTSMGGGCAQTPPPMLPVGSSGDSGWDNESKDPDKYLKKLHTQERAVEEVKLAIKPYYQRKDINKDEYKDILRKAVHKICHSRTGEINPVKVSNLVKLYVQRYKYFRKHGRKMDEEEREDRETGALHSSA